MAIHKEIDLRHFLSVRTFSILLLILFGVWLILMITGHSSQKDYFFLNCQDYMADFTKPMMWIKNNAVYAEKNPNSAQWHCYPPAAVNIFRPLQMIANHINPNSHYSIMFVATVTCYFLIYVFLTLLSHQFVELQAIDKILFSSAIFFSSVFLIFMERGNIIILTALSSAFFLFYHDSPHKVIKECALIALAFAFATKISPAIFGVLLLFKKEYAAACRAGIYAILIYLGGFLFLEGSVADNFWILNQNIQYLMAVIGVYDNSFDRVIVVSLLEKIVNGVFQLNWDFAQIYHHVMHPLLFIIFAIIFFSDFLHDVWWRKTLHCALAAILLPNFAYQYTALYLLPPLVLFLKHPHKSHADQLYFLYFLLLLSPVKLGSTPGNLISEISWLMLLENLLMAFITIWKKATNRELQFKKLAAWMPFRETPRLGLWYLANFILLFSILGLLIMRPGKVAEAAIFTSPMGKAQYNYSGNWDPKLNGLKLLCDFIPAQNSQTQNIFQIGDVKNSIHFMVSSHQKPQEASLIFYSPEKLKRSNITLPQLIPGHLYRLLLSTCGHICNIELLVLDPQSKKWNSVYTFNTWHHNNFNVQTIALGSQQNGACPFYGKNLRFGLFKQTFEYWNYLAIFPAILWGILVLAGAAKKFRIF